jgi:hypothetical protein
MPRPHLPAHALALAILLHAAPVLALEPPAINFSGFGTLGVVHSEERRGDYLVDLFRPEGAGFSQRWSPEVDSRFGLQATATWGTRLSAVVQVLSRQRYDDTFTPAVEWANVRYQATPDLAVRAGRIVLPMFLVTDTRFVGYANPWVRPPVEVYSLVPISNSDGIDASYRLAFGGMGHTLQASLGRTEPRLPGDGADKAFARDLLVLVDTVESGFLTARLTLGQASLTVPAVDRQLNAFRQLGSQGEAIAARNTVVDREVWFMGIGASYDPGPWFVTAEWAKFDTRSILGAKRSWYVSGGRRLGAFTPYATYARTADTNVRSDPGFNLAALPPALRATAAALNVALSRSLSAPSGQETWTLGVRWEFSRSAALKLQYDHVRLAPGSSGAFDPKAPGFPSGGRIGLFSAAVDCVF